MEFFEREEMSLLSKIPKKQKSIRGSGCVVRLDQDTFKFVVKESKKRNMTITEFMRQAMLILRKHK
jgi:hypothetical protein